MEYSHKGPDYTRLLCYYEHRAIPADKQKHNVQPDLAVNVSIDTLPTNASLKRWSKHKNAKYDWCDQLKTLHHTLTNCQAMLERYTLRHYSILNYIHKAVKDSLTEDTGLYNDLSADCQGASKISTDVAITIQTPDIITVTKSQHKVIHFELSVRFKSNIDDTHYRKVERFAKLISDIENNGYEVI